MIDGRQAATRSPRRRDGREAGDRAGEQADELRASSCHQASTSQVTAANDAAMSVLRKATAVTESTWSSLPALKPIPAEPQQAGAERDERNDVQPARPSTWRLPT